MAGICLFCAIRRTVIGETPSTAATLLMSTRGSNGWSHTECLFADTEGGSGPSTFRVGDPTCATEGGRPQSRQYRSDSWLSEPHEVQNMILPKMKNFVFSPLGDISPLG